MGCFSTGAVWTASKRLRSGESSSCRGGAPGQTSRDSCDLVYGLRVGRLALDVGPRPVGSRAQQRQNIGAELVQEARLVEPGGMEHQVVEAEVEVGADAIDDLFRVVGDDEARRG